MTARREVKPTLRPMMERRLAMIREALGGRAVTLMIDETGSRKKGSTTDYVDRQYLRSLGKIDNSLVTVHLVALVGELTFPLSWRVFKPQSRLREGEPHQSKLALAVELLDDLRALVRPLGALVTLSLWTHLFPIDARLITSSFRILFAIPPL